MRMSCNGCRVLRKGCSENCSIRPCLVWIKTPESQANATVFLAKFYGRAGLMNLINAGPDHLRPAIFRSLLYEACGRIVNPIYGSVGLLWSGSWPLCQAAVEAVLKGSPITPIASDSVAATAQGPPLKAYDIRHVSKDDNSPAAITNVGDVSHKVKSRKRSAQTKPKVNSKPAIELEEELTRSMSHESSLSHLSELAERESKESAVQSTAEAPLLFLAEPVLNNRHVSCKEPVDGFGLELRLGFEPVSRASDFVVPVKKRKIEGFGTCDDDASKVELGLKFSTQAN
ncbi:hypothetical protein ACFE04_004808 [Oxalis oulophora]